MRRALIAGAVLVLSGVAPPPAEAATVGVKTQGLKFVPAVANAQLGDTVLWSNAATDRHSSTSDGPTPWDSGRLNPWSGKFSRAFPFTGTFPYYCDIHRSLGMKGTVKVALKVTPTTGTTATDFVVTLGKAGIRVPTGYRFVVEKALGSGAYSTAIVTTNATAHFRATSKGTYKLRAGLQKTSGPVNDAWFSDPLALSVS
jgi:plastocyanin